MTGSLHIQEKRPNVFTTLDSLKFPLAMGVVMIHCDFIRVIPSYAADLDRFKIFITVWNWFLRIVVPAFFFISGYLFFRNGYLTLHSYTEKLKRRVNTLLIPYLIWNTIALLITVIKLTPMLAPYFPQYSGVFDSVWSTLEGFWEMPYGKYPYDMPLWFIRNLMVVVLLTPLISILLKYLKWFAQLLLLLGAIFIPQGLGMMESIWFFSLGAAFPLLKISISSQSKFVGLWWLLFLILSAVHTYVDAVPEILGRSAGIIALAGTEWHTCLFARIIPDTLRKSTFFIFACHGLYATVIQKLVTTILVPANSWIAVADYLIIFGVNLLITLSIYYAMHRFMPRVTKVLCGGR